MSRYHYKKRYSKHYRYKPTGKKNNTLSNRQYQAMIKKFKLGLLALGLFLATLVLLRSCSKQPNYPVKLPEALSKPYEKWI